MLDRPTPLGGASNGRKKEQANGDDSKARPAPVAQEPRPRSFIGCHRARFLRKSCQRRTPFVGLQCPRDLHLARFRIRPEFARSQRRERNAGEPGLARGTESNQPTWLSNQPSPAQRSHLFQKALRSARRMTATAQHFLPQPEDRFHEWQRLHVEVRGNVQDETGRCADRNLEALPDVRMRNEAIKQVRDGNSSGAKSAAYGDCGSGCSLSPRRGERLSPVCAARTPRGNRARLWIRRLRRLRFRMSIAVNAVAAASRARFDRRVPRQPRRAARCPPPRPHRAPRWGPSARRPRR